ncbi:MAG: DUF1700 domain-containing protein [bacterium]|nr:DUF1700 domain-containing protein [bacterium]
MTKEEYMGELRKKLKRLPKDNFNQAIEYFEEYFAEAGEENTAQAIEDLGSPQMAADQIIMDVAVDNSKTKEAKKDVRKGVNGVWVVILAIFASPIALPVVLVVVLLLLAFMLVVISLLVALGLTGAALAIAAPVAVLGALSTMMNNVPVALVCVGIGLLSLSLGALAIYASYLLIRKFLYWIVLIFGKKLAKGGKKNEAE